MRAARDARILRAVADIRELQARASESELARASRARRHATEQLEEGREAVAEAEQGWTAATADAFLDPGLSRAWLHELSVCRIEEHRLEQADRQAADEEEVRRNALRGAQARSDASKEQARRAARKVARHREEARLGAVEDQLSARRTFP